MKILKSQIANILNEIITTTDRSEWDAAYTHSIISGNSTVHHTHTNKTILDTYTQTNADIADAVTTKHVHANKAILDTYDQTNSDISTAVSQTHTHTNYSLLNSLTGFTNATLLAAIAAQHSHLNKALLDSYNQTNAAITGAVTNSHTHVNKALLDTLSGFTNVNLLASITNSHTHTNKATLDTYTQTEVNLADAVSKKHEHTNQALLDSITDAGAGTSFLANDGTYKTVTSGGVIGGIDTQVLFNDGGSSNGNANLIFNKTTGLTSMLEALVGQKFYVTNSSTFITKDASDNLTFTDAFNADITLTSLVGGSSSIPDNTTGDDVLLGRDSSDNWILFTLDDLAADTPVDTFVKWDTVENYYRFYTDKSEAGGAASDAKFYLGTSDPDGTTRLNYDGNFHASYFESYGGIFSTRVDNHAIRGDSTNGSGIFGSSINTNGVWGYSSNNTGVLGQSVLGNAGLFNSESTSLPTVKIYQEANSTANRASALLELSRTSGSTGGYNFTGNLLYINDSVTTTGTISGRALLYEANSIEKLSLYPRVPNSGSAVAYMLDTVNGLTTTAKLLSVRNAGIEKMSILQDGSVNIPTGATYNINGVPISSGTTPTDGILDWVTDKYQPYAAQQGSLSFDISVTVPTLSTLLNLNGRFRATGIDLSNNSGSLGDPTISIANSGIRKGIAITNSSTGYGIDLSNSSTGYGLQLSNTSTGYGIYLTNSSGYGINLTNSGASYGVYLTNSGTSYGTYIRNQSSGIGLRIHNSSTGKGTEIYSSAASSIGLNIVHEEDLAYTPMQVVNGAATVAAISNAGKVTGIGGAQFGTNTDNTTFEADGTMVFNGAATVWEDINIDVSPLQTGGTAPGFTSVNATGIRVKSFAVDEDVDGSFEIPHSYKLGSDITCHLHFIPVNAPTGTDYVKFEVTYCITDGGSSVPIATTINTGEVAVDTQWKRYDVNMSSTLSHATLGGQVIFKLKRVAATGDAFAGECGILTFGFHYEKDMEGSRQITTK